MAQPKKSFSMKIQIVILYKYKYNDNDDNDDDSKAQQIMELLPLNHLLPSHLPNRLFLMLNIVQHCSTLPNSTNLHLDFIILYVNRQTQKSNRLFLMLNIARLYDPFISIGISLLMIIIDHYPDDKETWYSTVLQGDFF